MSDQFYAVHYQLSPGAYRAAIFSLEEKAKNYATYLLETEKTMNGDETTSFTYEIENFVAIIAVDSEALPYEYEGVELIYVNDTIPNAKQFLTIPKGWGTIQA